MSPDHTPYLRPGVDLITAEDACAWLDGLTSGPARERIYGVLDAHAALSLRLDRERRQACRRAVARHFAEAREHREGERDWSDSGTSETFPRELLDDWARGARECRTESLKRALAFRAAARAK